MGRWLRCVLRPALSLKKLSDNAQEGVVRYRPGKEGLPQTLEWSPLRFMERFAAILPPPRKHLVRYYGALGPRSKLRPALTAAAKAQASCDELETGLAVQVLLAAVRVVARARPLLCQLDPPPDDVRRDRPGRFGADWPA